MSISHRYRWIRAVAVVAALVFAVACGEEGAGENDDEETNTQQDQDNGEDDDNGNGDDNGTSNGGIDDPADDCEEAIERDAEFTVDAPGDATAVYAPRMRRVGDELWTAFLAEFEVDDEDLLQPHLVRLECDGEVIEEPKALTEERTEEFSPPAIDADDEVAYVVWSKTVTHDGQFVPRSEGMAFETDGTAVVDEPFDIEVDIEGEEAHIDEVGSPDVAVAEAGNAFVVVERVVSPFASEVLFQQIDEEGTNVYQGLIVAPDGGSEQTTPAVGLLNDGRGLIAYADDGDAHFAAVNSQGQAVVEGPSAAEASLGEGNKSISMAVSKNLAADNTWVAYPLGETTNNTIKVRSGLALQPRDGESSSVSDRRSWLPSVAASDTGGAKAWASTGDEGAIIHYRRFQGGGTDTSGAGPVVDEHEEGGARTEPAIVWLTQEVFTAVWGEEDELVGRTVDFELVE